MNAPHPERAALELYIIALAAAGFTPSHVNNGGEDDEPTPTLAEMLDEATATDESHLYFTGPGPFPWWAYAVFGNSPAELINDYSSKPAYPEASAAFERAITSTSEALENADAAALMLKIHRLSHTLANIYSNAAESPEWIRRTIDKAQA